jgi:DNA-binding CsgD family transcriptional regulator
MGSSDREVASLDIEAAALDIEAVVARLGLRRFALAGIDSAAAIAVTYAAMHPERIWGLVLLNAFVSGRRRLEAVPAARVELSILEQVEDEWTFATSATANLSTRFDNPAHAREIADLIQASMLPGTYVADRKALLECDLTPYLAKLDLPTLVIHDTGFPFGAFELCQQVASQIRNCRFHVVRSDPLDEINAIDGFLRSISSPELWMEVQTPESVVAGRLSGVLSAREVEVLRLLAGGRSNQQIADELVISLNTVRRHVSNILGKTGAANRADAVSYAHRNGIV